MPRTVESLQHVIHGLYPTAKRSGDVPAEVLIRQALISKVYTNTIADLVDVLGMGRTRT
jgi:hypothetical protein